MILFPHCDTAVLLAPKTCEFCDLHSDWQDLRIAWGINFTGENDPDKAPCPSTRTRSVDDVHAWPGNRPQNRPNPFGYDEQELAE